jgi:hypothetical protein
MTKNLDEAAEIVRGVVIRILSEKNAEIEHKGLDITQRDAYVTSDPSNQGKEPQNEDEG